MLGLGLAVGLGLALGLGSGSGLGLGSLVHGLDQRGHRGVPAQWAVVLHHEDELRARSEHGAPHTQGEASVLELLDQLGLARNIVRHRET